MHRPGPWTVDPESTNIKCEVPNVGCVREDHGDGMHLALVFADGDISMESAKANARLMAAAPMMLVILKRCQYFMQENPELSRHYLVEHINEAIAKAEGRS